MSKTPSMLIPSKSSTVRHAQLSRFSADARRETSSVIVTLQERELIENRNRFRDRMLN